MALDRFAPRGTEEAILLVGGLFFLLQGVDLLVNITLSIYEDVVRSGRFPVDTIVVTQDTVNYLVGLMFLIVGLVLLLWSRRLHRPFDNPPPPPPPR